MNKGINQDIQFKLLAINLALVIVGYAMTLMTNSASIIPMRILKYTVLGLSFLCTFRIDSKSLGRISTILEPSLLLIVMLVLFSLFTENPLTSIFKTLTFIVPFIYISFVVTYLAQTYSISSTINALLGVMNWVYMIPIVSFFISGGSLTDTNIYYISVENENTAFVSNHYGWSSTIFIVTGIDLIRNNLIPNWRKFVTYITIPVAMYLILVSGNRTSWLCVSVVLVIAVVRYNGISFPQKAILIIIPILLISILLNKKDSALNTVKAKTESQSKKGESRIKRSSAMFNYFHENPILFISGIGMFNNGRASSIIGKSNYHNSYMEILFGAGIPFFLYFLFLIVIRPGWNYLLYFSKYYLTLPPLMIIPFFESNLTGGQFLFFPWFSLVIIFMYAKKIASFKRDNWHTP